MDEYSTKAYDIAQLKFVCENLYDEGIAALGDSHHGWVNDPTSSLNLQLNELIEHIASFLVSYKIKYIADNGLAELVEEYLEDTYTLFSDYGINDSDLPRWQKTKVRLSSMFSENGICIAMKSNGIVFPR